MEQIPRNKPFCIVPWGAVSILPNGDVIPCTASNTKLPSVLLGNIKTKTFRDIWSDAPAMAIRKAHYEQPFKFAGCGLCVEQETRPGVSKREEMRDKYGSFFERAKVNFGDIKDPSKIIFLDMALSSLCNLNCTMCSSTYSTSWLELDKKMAAANFDNNPKPTSHTGFENIRDNLTSLFDYLENLHFLFLKGGEPLLNKDCLWFMEQLVERGIASQVTLAIITNGTIYNDKISDLFNKFKRVELVVSLDAVGELYHYIRSGGKFASEDIISNIQKIKAANKSTWVTISPSLQAYNALRFSELIEVAYAVADEVYCNIWVIDPIYQSVISLPEELHSAVVVELEKTIRFLEGVEPENKSIPFIKYVIGYLLKEVPWLKIHTQGFDHQMLFRNYTKIIDQERGLKLGDIIPEMKAYI